MEGVGWRESPGSSTVQDPAALLAPLGGTATPEDAPGPLSALVPAPVTFRLLVGFGVWDQVWCLACVGCVRLETD